MSEFKPGETVFITFHYHEGDVRVCESVLHAAVRGLKDEIVGWYVRKSGYQAELRDIFHLENEALIASLQQMKNNVKGIYIRTANTKAKLKKMEGRRNANATKGRR